MPRLAFLTDMPHLLQSLDPRLNGDIDPSRISLGSGRKLWWRCPNGPDHVYQTVVYHRGQGKGCPYCAGQRLSVTNRLSTVAPDVARQWHTTKNGELTPDDVVAGSHRHAWWQCPEGPDHEWRAGIRVRAIGGYGCPFCAGRKASVTNRLSVIAPFLADQWHPSRNGDLTPDDVTTGSPRQVWWQCPKGSDHLWTAPIAGRMNAPGCPFCVGLRVSVTNRLSTIAPKVARQWHPTRNGALTADDVIAGTNRYAWWRCPKGPDHEWQAVIHARALRGAGCPFCANKRVSVKNCLATKNPTLAAEWHPTKNGKLTPRDVTAGSSRKVWWKCPRNPRHHWQTEVYHRARNGCPHCANRVMTPDRMLGNANPALAALWHPTKNGNLTPFDVAALSHRKVWWKCPHGPDHEWETTPACRSQSQGACPFCIGRRLSVTNCLATRFPAVALQWHPTRNGSLLPSQIYAFAQRKVWWCCPAGHAWQCRLDRRTRGNTGCPGCRHRKRRQALTHKRRRKVWLPGDWK